MVTDFERFPSEINRLATVIKWRGDVMEKDLKRLEARKENSGCP